MKQSEALKLVVMLQACFPEARMTEITVDAYAQILEAKLDYQLARDAVTQLICTSKFLPKIAEILDAAANLSLGQTRTGVDAWGDVTMAVRRVGSYGNPKFKDPIVAECVKAMGWRHICLGAAGEATDRARFCELYSDLQKKQRVRDVSDPGRLLPAVDSTDARALPGNVVDLVRKVGR